MNVQNREKVRGAALFHAHYKKQKISMTSVNSKWQVFPHQCNGKELRKRDLGKRGRIAIADPHCCFMSTVEIICLRSRAYISQEIPFIAMRAKKNDSCERSLK
jgi:hypothetical protein